MTDPSQQGDKFELRPGRAAGSAAAGARLELLDGSVCTLVENPVDGVWLYVVRDGATEDEAILLGTVKRVIDDE